MKEQEFCGLCDYGPNGYSNCGKTGERKPTPAQRDRILEHLFCTYSRIEGIQVSTEEDRIAIQGSPGKEVSRPNEDLRQLRVYIQGKKAWTKTLKIELPRVPKPSPLEKALSQ